MKNSFRVSFITTLPKEGNAPSVSITGNQQQRYKVMFHESLAEWDENIVLVSEGYCYNNQTISAKSKQWFTRWIITVYDETGSMVFKDIFDPQDEVIFIKMDAWALGDSIAWIPYVEEFRKKHYCNVICSTFYNHLFVEAYPHIQFVKPNTVIENVYAQYYIGASNDNNPHYSPIRVDEHPLQNIAARILGLDVGESRPNLRKKYEHSFRRISDKYVTLSEFGSHENKHWKVENGWQGVVDYLGNKGYKVVVISKEKTKLTGVIDLSGEYPLDERAIDILHAEFHLGISSGLSWLAWGLGKHVVMISDVTPNWHEFQSDITRINSNNLTIVNYLSETQSTLANVLEKLGDLIVL